MEVHGEEPQHVVLWCDALRNERDTRRAHDSHLPGAIRDLSKAAHVPVERRATMEGRYFATTKKGEVAEWKIELRNMDKDKRKDAVKKVIAAMTVGKVRIEGGKREGRCEAKRKDDRCTRPRRHAWPIRSENPMGSDRGSVTMLTQRCFIHVQDVSSLFPDVVNCMQTDDLEMKKLVYLYLINYAKSKPDLAIMAVNTFVKVKMHPFDRMETEDIGERC